MSFALVLAAAVTLVVGLLQSGLTLIYVSIACSVVAGLVLALAVLRGRPEAKPAAVGGGMSPQAAAPPPSAAAPTRTFERDAEPEREPATVGGGWGSASETATPPPPPRPVSPPSRPPAEDSTQAAGAALLGRLRRKSGQAPPEPEPVAAEPPDVDGADTSETAVVEAPPERADVTEQFAVSAVSADDGFPIADYDRLRATDIIGRLDSLDRDQLEQVREREAATKNRFTVMNRIDARLEEAGEPEWEIADDEWEEAPAEGAVDELAEEDEFAAEDDYAEVDVVVDAGQTADSGFPIPEYESLRVSQILPLLATLSPAERDQVRQREEQGRARSTILDRIRRLDSGAGSGDAIAMPPPALAARKRASTRKASPIVLEAAPRPRKAPAKRGAVSAKKAAASAEKVTAPAKKVAAAAKARKVAGRGATGAPGKAAAQKAVKAAAKSAGVAKAARSTRTAPGVSTPEPTSKRAAVIKKATKKAR